MLVFLEIGSFAPGLFVTLKDGNFQDVALTWRPIFIVQTFWQVLAICSITVS